MPSSAPSPDTPGQDAPSSARRKRATKDHDLIRRTVAEAVRTLIVQRGMDSVTNREIARELDYSTSIVQHYFANKHEMMRYVHAYTNDLAMVRVREAIEAAPDSLTAMLKAYMPIDDERRTNWLVWIAFWGMAVANSEFSVIQNTGVDAARQLFEDRIDALKALGSVRPAVDTRAVGLQLTTLLQGVGIQAAFNPEEWTPAYIDAYLDAECRSFLEGGASA